MYLFEILPPDELSDYQRNEIASYLRAISSWGIKADRRCKNCMTRNKLFRTLGKGEHFWTKMKFEGLIVKTQVQETPFTSHMERPVT